MKRFNFLIFLLSFSKIINSNFIIPLLEPNAALKVVKTSSQILPNFDTVGHYVLTLNEKLITNVINSNLNYDIKKFLILKIIEVTQQGDELGGLILQNYYEFVDKIL